MSTSPARTGVTRSVAGAFGHLQTFDLVDSKAGGLADLLKVYSLVRIGHLDLGGEGVEEEAGGEWADGLLALRCT